MKLWDKGFHLDHKIESFTIGKDRELDLDLAKYDVIGSKAHANMLASIGMISEGENNRLQEALDGILEKISNGAFVIDEGMEDVHSQVEFLLTKKLGDTGKKIHLGRSRNDQVLLDLRLYFRDQLDAMTMVIRDLIEILIKRAEEHKNDLLPGYTHMQVGMVSSFGMWFTAFAEGLLDDLALVCSTRQLINRNPLGTAAGYGSSIPLDRELTTQELGFEGLCINPINAQLGRGKSELLVSQVIANIGLTLNKFAYDLCLYSNENFGFFELPAAFTTGSSIMPHKKNPDVFELIRAKSNLLMSLPVQVTQIISNLPTGYHRDFQLLKELLFPGIKTVFELLELTTHSMNQIVVKKVDTDQDIYKYMFSVELVNEYVKQGMSFRDAYKKVGDEIQNGTYEAPGDLNHSHIGSIGNLGLKLLQKRLYTLVHKKD